MAASTLRRLYVWGLETVNFELVLATLYADLFLLIEINDMIPWAANDFFILLEISAIIHNFTCEVVKLR